MAESPVNDQLTMLAISMGGPIVGIVGTLVTQYIASRYAQHNAHAALKAEKLELERRIASFQSENLVLKTKSSEIQNRYDEKFGKEAVLAKYSLHPTAKTYIRDGSHFCPACLSVRQHEVPLPFVNGHGLRCPECKTVFQQ